MTLPAHRFILASRLTNDVLDNNVTIDSDSMASLNFSKVDQHSIKHWLNKIYSGNSVQLPDIQPANRSHSKSELEARKSDLEEVGDGELLSNGLTRLTLKDFEGPDGLESRTIFSEKGVLVQQLSKKNASKMSKKKRGDKLQSVQDNSTKKKNNRILKVMEKHTAFVNWQDMDDLSDIIIESEDGVQFQCHRCLLVARLDYFRSMLANEWMEAGLIGGSLRMPVPGRVLKVIIDYLYTDEAPSVKDCLNLEFLGEVIIHADQFLISRLREICESALARQISLKNALEMLEVACTFNAEQLKMFCCEFISINLTYYLESRLLESLSTEVLQEVSKSYRELVPNMSFRKITPSTYHLEQDMLLSEKDEKGENTRKSGTSDKVGVRADDEGTDDVFDEKASPREKGDNFTKKKRRRRKSSSSKDNNPVEESSTKPDPMKAADSQKSPKKPDQIATSVEQQITNSKIVLPPFEEKTPENSMLAKEEMPSKVSKSSLNWIASSPPSNVFSLKSIMEQEEQRKMAFHGKQGKTPSPISKQQISNQNAKSPGTANLNPAIKWDSSKKKSQKQRKLETDLIKSRLSAAVHAEEAVVNGTQELQPKKFTCPWATPSPHASPQKSLRDVMEEESKSSSPRRDGLFAGQPSSGKQSIPGAGARKRLSWQENKDKNNQKEHSSAWNSSILASSPPSAEFASIIVSQQEEKESAARVLKKPLPLIQIEEKAIEDLLGYYNAKDNPSEYVTVERVPKIIASPTWNISRK